MIFDNGIVRNGIVGKVDARTENQGKSGRGGGNATGGEPPLVLKLLQILSIPYSLPGFLSRLSVTGVIPKKDDI